MRVLRGREYQVLIRALKMRVHNHATDRCACDFCKAYRKLVGGAR